MTKNKKWNSPLENMLAADKFDSISEYMDTLDQNTIYSVVPTKVKRWEEKDRPENELGNIEELAESIKSIGQQVPCIVREIKDNKYKFELIVGERRWRAALLVNIELKVIVSNVDDREASLIQAIENEQRNDLSDYAKGISYYNKIQLGFLTQKDLTEKLGKTKQEVSRLLSFSRIPESINNAIKDYQKVSARTASEISRLANKDKMYEEAIIAFADKIREGKLGHSGIMKLINKTLSEYNSYTEKVCNNDGEHLLTWKNDNNLKTISFSSKISKKIDKKTFKMIVNEVLKCINN